LIVLEYTGIYVLEYTGTEYTGS